MVQLGRFRGEIEVEEAGFFVLSFDAPTGELRLSDRTTERLDPSTLSTSPHDGALLCRVKPDLAPGGLLARFSHAAQAELLLHVEETGAGYVLKSGGGRLPVPNLGG